MDDVRVSVCVSVCVSVPFPVVYFEAYFAPTSRSRISKNFKDSESLGKSAGKKWSQNWTFLLGCGLKLPRKKKLALADFALQNMVETTLPDGLETSGRRVYRYFWHISRHFCFFLFWIIFSVLNFFGFCVFLVHPTVASLLLSASVKRFDVSRMRDFYLIIPKLKGITWGPWKVLTQIGLGGGDLPPPSKVFLP